MKNHRIPRAWVACLVLSSGLPAIRLAAAELTLEERLHQLELKVSVLEKENAALRAGPAASSTTSPAPLPGGKENKLVIGGFMQGQAEFGSAPDSRFSGIADRAFFRRARIYLTGTFAENFEFKIEGEFGAGSLAATTGLRAQANELFIGWTRFPAANIRFGQLKPAFGGEQLASDTRLPLIERSLASDRLTDGRQLGASVGGTFLDKRLTYLVTAGQGNGTNTSANDNNKFEQAARVAGTLVDSASTGRLVVGGNVFRSEDAGVSKNGLGFDAVAGGALDNLFFGKRDGSGVDVQWQRGIFELSAEWLRMRYHPLNALPASVFHAQGGHLTAACFLIPTKVQAVLRREFFDPNTQRAGDQSNTWIAGLNYLIKGDDLKLMADYLAGNPAGIAEHHNRLLLRVQTLY